MTLEKFILSRREKYIQHLIEWTSNMANVSLEEFLILTDGQEENELYQLFRQDCIQFSPHGNENIDIVSDAAIENLGYVFKYKNIEIIVNSFFWDNVAIELSKLPSKELLNAWILKWIDFNDKKKEDLFGLKGVIHEVSHIVLKWKIIFLLDFGSAPLAAFFELLEVFADSQIEKVLVDLPEKYRIE